MNYIVALIWLAAMAFFIILEAASVQLYSVWFAVGSLVAGIVSLFIPSVTAQLIVFMVVSLVSLIFMRKFAIACLGIRKVPTNADSIIGMVGRVDQDIDAITGGGRVFVNGLSWKATSATHQSISSGVQVKILEIKGVTVVVVPVEG